MAILNAYITVRGDEQLERAIAADIGSMDDKELTEDFLEQMSTQYTRQPGQKTSVVETLGNGGQDITDKD